MRVGVTQRIMYHNGIEYDSLEHGWYSVLTTHEIIPIANDVNQDFSRIADQIDILILSGGNDPSKRRIVETKLVTAMLIRNKPILGICHGYFLLSELFKCNVVDIEGHHNINHTVTYRGMSLEVNSFHTLTVKDVVNTITSLLNDCDGNCEAWIHSSLKIAGMAWHPERINGKFIPEEILSMLGVNLC